MPTNQELDQWLLKVRQAASRDEVFKLLDEFRQLEWTDEQRSVMAKTYVRLLEERLKAQPSDSAAAATKKDGADGPVWYEKM